MVLGGVESVASPHLAPLAPDGVHDGLFDLLLRRPAPLVSRQPQVPTSNDDHSFSHARQFTLLANPAQKKEY
jgi:hypothetical protein